MEFEKAILEWFGPSAYADYSRWASSRGFVPLPEDQWRARCVAAAIMAAGEFSGPLNLKMDAALEALRGVGSR
jgi:hypothetical protein